jgi:exosortase
MRLQGVCVRRQRLRMAFRRNALQCHAKLRLRTNSPSDKLGFALGMDLVSSRPVQDLATPHKFRDASPEPRNRVRLWVVLAVLAALCFGLCRELSGEWSVNEQYSFGWFVPFFALYLFWLRWQDAPEAKTKIPNAAAFAIAITALLVLLPVRLFEIANPDWRLLAWVHAAAVAALTLWVIWWAGGVAWLRHFAFPVLFIFVAVPWPTLLETPVSQGLMRLVARVAAETAMLLGTPAQVEGNLIRVSNGLVGVNQACSGIRSLQTSLMIGLLFGELKRLSMLRRVALVICAVAIALLANFVRAVFLLRIAATKNLVEVGRWHDVAGYSIVAVVFLGTVGFAYLLGKSEIRNPKSEVKNDAPQSAIGNRQSAIPFPYIATALCWLLLVEIGTASWYRLHERNLISGTRLGVRWPEEAPNFRKLKIDAEIRAVLRFDEGEAAAWSVASALNRSGSDTILCSLFAFRWNPGKNSALLANLHRPDVCLPASGWKRVADDGVRSYPVSGSFELPFRHFEFQRAFEGSASQTAHAFYCLSHDRASNASISPVNSRDMFGSPSKWTRTERLRTVLEGRRHLGQQVIEVIFISGEPLSGAEAESHLRDLLPNLVAAREL